MGNASFDLMTSFVARKLVARVFSNDTCGLVFGGSLELNTLGSSEIRKAIFKRWSERLFCVT